MDWERSYQNNEIPWEKGQPAPPLVEYLEKNKISGHVLVPGCGTGHDVRLLASRGCHTHGIDISSTAIDLAHQYPKPEFGTATYRLVDFLASDNNLPTRHYDFVVEHTCFCAIQPSQRSAYIKAVHRSLKPGGYLLAILFTHLEEPGGPPYSTTPAEIETYFTPMFTIEQYWRPTRFHEGRDNEESMYLMKRRDLSKH
ncbi:Thiopurine S-methyltransferase superfamily [Verrucomicrobiia bacterium DG1235]|nr:Thiopurine S-methyltransferase superfamily [Verrucomicrobiae bacterium DG1235]